MKSIQRSSKPQLPQAKSNNLSRKPELVAYRAIEQPPVTLQVDPTSSDESPLVEQQAQTVPPLTSKPNAAEKPQQFKQQGQLTKSHEEELAPERCQHIQFLDCDKLVGRVILECWHCQQGIISEFTGEPVMGEYKGRPSLVQLKIQCPNCEQTAIRLTTGQVLSTTAIPSPWQQ